MITMATIAKFRDGRFISDKYETSLIRHFYYTYNRPIFRDADNFYFDDEFVNIVTDRNNLDLYSTAYGKTIKC